MSKPRPANSNAVSLFPFLAVLVCAMGALIFLLIVTTRRIRIQAVARAAEIHAEKQEARKPVVVPMIQQPDPTLESPPIVFIPDPKPKPKPVVIKPPPDPDLAVKSRIAALQDRHDQEQKKLKAQQARLAREQSKAKSRADELKQKAIRLTRVTDALRDSDQATNAILAVATSLKEKIVESNRRIVKAKSEQANADSKFSFVPFDGKSGTNMRPILIECTNRAIKFVPEDIALTPADLDGFTQSYNPVLSGTRALVQHWYEWNLNQPKSSDHQEPYVLLLVRPNGSLSFYIARKLLAKLGRPYGYELIDKDFPLALPEPDPDAVTVCQAAIDKTLADRKQLLAEISRGSVLGSAEQLRLKRGGGGEFRFEDDPIARAQGRGTGSGSGLSNNGRPGRVPLPRQPIGMGRGATASQRFFGSQEFVRRERPGDGQSDESLNGGVGQRSDGTGQRNDGTGQSNGGTGVKNGGTGVRNGGTGQPDENTQNSVGTGPGNRTSSNSVGGSSNRDSQRRGNDVGNDPFDEGSSGQIGRGTGTGNTANGTTRGSAGKQYPKTTAGADRGTRSSNQTDSNQSSNNGGGSSGGPGQQIPTFAPLSLGGSNSRSSRSNSAKRRWGLSNPRAGIGLERKVTVYVEADQISIGKTSVKADLSKPHIEFVNEVIQAIDLEVRRWGKPPRNFYWVPMIKFRISPGGNIHYERMKRELDKVGLSVAVEHTLGIPEAQEPQLQP